MAEIVKPVKPTLDPDMLPYVEAFYDLNSCRSIGMGAVGSIPYTAILHWLEFWDVGDADIFISIVQAIDHVYMSIVNEEAKDG